MARIHPLIRDPFLWLMETMIVAAIGMLMLAMPAQASTCGQFFANHHAVVAQQVIVPAVAVSPYIYQAGRDVEAEALAAKVAKLVVGQLRAELRTGSTQQQSTPASALAQHCAKCHSGAAPKAGVVFDGVTYLACNQVTAALRAIRDETMPKDHKVSAEVKGQLMEELLNLESPADRPQRVEVPPPEPSGELK